VRPAENIFTELKRFIRFGSDDEAALRRLHPFAAPHFPRIAELFYDRLREHEAAGRVLSSPTQLDRLQQTLRTWLDLLLTGPWDEVYYDKRARIGRIHVEIGLPQRYMFGSMNLIRAELGRIADDALPGDDAVRRALLRILDLELAIMLESFGDAFVMKTQALERIERERLEQKLALSEARYEEIVEKGEALIVTAGADGGILLFNRRCEDLCGISRARAVGRSWIELFAPETDRAALVRLQADALSGLRVAAYEGPVAASGRRVRWHFTTLPDPTRPVLCAIGIDVTEEHELAVRTRRAERLAALGTMAAGLAHEIRNPLNAAHLQLALAQRRLARPIADVEGASDAAELAATEMRRLATLVTEFLQFARPQPLRLSHVDLRATVRAIVDLFSPEATAAGCHLAIADGAPVPVAIDDERMKQVVLNLVKNAVEAAGRGGHVEVDVGAREAEVFISVADDGPGLAEPDAPIFEPFYTTKEEGTGLGLAIVHRIVADHTGRVGVQSEPGNTIFTVVLPVAS
jgi:PAS domain S-box-containing protein